MALSASQATFEALGDVLRTAGSMACMASLDEMGGTDPAPMINQAKTRGSLALSTPELRGCLSRAPERDLGGAQETDYALGSIVGAVALPVGSRLRSVDEDGWYIRVLLPGGGLEFGDQLGWHSAAILYLDALCLGPLTDLGGVQPARRSPTPCSRCPTGTAADPPRGADIAGQRVAERLGVFLVQVDLVLRTVDPEPDGSFGGTAVKVIYE